MKRHISFGSIEQFRNVITSVSHRARYAGTDEDGTVCYDKNVKPPKITVSASEKIHGCFHKDTMVTLANGEKLKISDITEGMSVLTFNTETGEQEVNAVLGTLNQNLDKDWCRLVFDKTAIVCTKDHKFWTKNRGWVEAQNLISADEFETTF